MGSGSERGLGGVESSGGSGVVRPIRVVVGVWVSATCRSATRSGGGSVGRWFCVVVGEGSMFTE